MLTSIFSPGKYLNSEQYFKNSEEIHFSFSLRGKQTLHLCLKCINQKRNVELFMIILN